MSPRRHSPASNCHPPPFTAWPTAAGRRTQAGSSATRPGLWGASPAASPPGEGANGTARVAWLGPGSTVGWGCWRRCRRASSPTHVTPRKHQHGSFPKSLLFLRLKHLATAWAAEPRRLFRALVPSSVLQRAERRVTGVLTAPTLREERSWGSFLTQAHQVSCAPHPQLLLCSEEKMLHRNCTNPHF